MPTLNFDINVDINDVFNEMPDKEKTSFMNENIQWTDNEIIKEHAMEMQIVSLSDFTDDELLNEMRDRGLLDE